MMSDELIGFFSYKGGVGRTVLLCNTALTLIQRLLDRTNRQEGVFCVDLDLPAPGILPVFGLHSNAEFVFQNIFTGNTRPDLTQDTVLLKLDNLGIPLRILAEETPDTDAIEFLTDILSGREDHSQLQRALAYLKDQGRKITYGRFTLLDLGSGLGQLPMQLFESLDQLVLTLRADRQHKEALPHLLKMLEDSFVNSRILPKVHLVLNQLPSTWIHDDENKDREKFLKLSGLRDYMSKAIAHNGQRQIRSLTLAPMIESGLTHEPVFFPQKWQYPKPVDNNIMIREPDIGAEEDFRQAVEQLSRRLLAGHFED